MIIAIGADQGPLIVNLSHMMGTTIMNAEAEIHLRDTNYELRTSDTFVGLGQFTTTSTFLGST